MKKPAFNPYLPEYEYVPDGEPHLFDGRVYVYGSHDRAFGEKYCEDDYVVWSAPEDDLSDWRFEGVSYRRTQDPSNANDEYQLWAPDVTRGPDGKYYLYYCLSFYHEIGVAVSGSPAGPFEFYGHVKYPASIRGGAVLREHMPFDPAVLTDDDGRVYLYYGFAPAKGKEMSVPDPEGLDIPEEEKRRLRKIAERFAGEQFSEYSMVAELEADMLTLKEEPRELIPGGHHEDGTDFEGHGFFEASSIRKVGERYYFVYSSHLSHELCYAVSDKPDRDFAFGGTLVSNGDIGLDGRTEPVNVLGNNHGGMVRANGNWYIFYHRQTHGTEFSRQGCAERLEILPDGSIEQVEITSCGLNGGPLPAAGEYPAYIACHITDPTTRSSIDYGSPVMREQTRITSVPGGKKQYVTGIRDGSAVGFKYFDFRGVTALALSLRGSFDGTVSVCGDAEGQEEFGRAALAGQAGPELSVPLNVPDGVHALYLRFRGSGSLELDSLRFSAREQK